MLSEYYPQWIVTLIGVAIAAAGDRIPREYKALVLAMAVAAVTAAVVATTPLGVESAVDQALILYGLLAGGFTAASMVERRGKLGAVAGGGALLVAAGLTGTGSAVAQAAAGAGVPPEVAAPSVGGLLTLLLGFGYGWLARLIRAKVG